MYDISLLDDFVDRGLVLQKHKSDILEKITTATDYIDVFLESYSKDNQNGDNKRKFRWRETLIMIYT